MKYKPLLDLPEHIYTLCWWREKIPDEYKDIVANIKKKSDEVFLANHKKNIDICPISNDEVDSKMGARPDFYEHYPILACNHLTRPDEWTYFYDSLEANRRTRGDICETKIGDWYFILGFQYD